VSTLAGVNDVVGTLRAAGCVFAEEEAALLIAAAGPGELEAMVAERVAGRPLEQIVGWASFAGLRIALRPGVFVPRRRTELLVRLALAERPRTVVELCCGAGAISAALLAARPDLVVHAADIDPVAVACARANLPGAHVYEGDLDAPLPADLAGRVDVLVANAPYVPTGEIGLMPPEARDHEPMTALDGGPDGLTIARRVLAAAPRWLRPGGVAVVETSVRQAPLLGGEAVTDDELGGTAVVVRRG
jgi:release factor glutamine methyltransferase